MGSGLDHLKVARQLADYAKAPPLLLIIIMKNIRQNC